MVAIIVISVLTCIATVTLALLKPSVAFNVKSGKRIKIDIFWFAPFVGAIVMLSCGFIGIGDLWNSLTADMWSGFTGGASSKVNPIKILILFFSMTSLSIVLDELGFFKYLALKTLQKAGDSQKRLFVLLYLIVSILTVFTSNDIVILTFTPFICCFCINAKIDPIPYVVAEFVAANTLSMFLIIGNPTNIYLASSYGIGFLNYIAAMAIPTLIAGLVAFFILFLLFRKKLAEPIDKSAETIEIENKPMLVIALVHITACILLLAISDFIGVEMWFLTLCFAVSLNICSLICFAAQKQKPIVLWTAIKRIPWSLAPFVLSMFVIILSLEAGGVTEKLAVLLSSGGSDLNILSFGLSGALVANLVNNIPMSVLYSSMAASGKMGLMGVYAAIVGSNIGAYLTPIGALAGIMCVDITEKNGVKFGFMTFAKYGVITAIPVLFATLGGLYLSSLFVL